MSKETYYVGSTSCLLTQWTVHKHTHAPTHTHTRAHTHTHAHMHTHTHTVDGMYTSTRERARTHRHTHTRQYVCVCVCACLYILCVCVCVCVCLLRAERHDSDMPQCTWHGSIGQRNHYGILTYIHSQTSFVMRLYTADTRALTFFFSFFPQVQKQVGTVGGAGVYGMLSFDVPHSQK